MLKLSENPVSAEKWEVGQCHIRSAERVEDQTPEFRVRSPYQFYFRSCLFGVVDLDLLSFSLTNEVMADGAERRAELFERAKIVLKIGIAGIALLVSVIGVAIDGEFFGIFSSTFCSIEFNFVSFPSNFSCTLIDLRSGVLPPLYPRRCPRYVCIRHYYIVRNLIREYLGPSASCRVGFLSAVLRQ